MLTVSFLRGRRLNFISTTLKLAVFTFSSLSSATFVLLTCVPVEGLPGRSYVFLAADTECHTGWQFALFLLLALLVSLPVLALVLAKNPNRLASSFERSRISLFACLLAHAYGFSVTSCCPSSLVRRAESTTPGLLQSSRELLSSPFTDGAFWWQSVLVLQILLTSLLFAFVTSPVSRTLSMAAACALFMGAHITAQPFKHPLVNVSQSCHLTLLLLLAVLSVPRGTIVSSATTPATLSSLLSAVQAAQAALLLLPLPLFIAVKLLMRRNKQRDADMRHRVGSLSLQALNAMPQMSVPLMDEDA